MKGVKEMRNRKLLGILPVFILVLAACVPAPLDTTGTVAPTEPVATEPLTTETQMAETPTTGATTVAETPTTGIPVTGSATVNVSETADFGPVLVNDEDYSLYVS
jgi:hypothetical protein